MARIKEDDRQLTAGENTDSESGTHAAYEVMSETGKNVGVNILLLYYGELWQTALDRLNYRFDGHMFTINHEGKKYTVYRKIKLEIHNISYRLKLV
jgi:hypothetical protein